MSKIAKNTSILLAGEMISKVISLVLTLAVTRILGVEEFGRFSFALGFAALFIIIADLGINNYLRREIAIKEKQMNSFVVNSFLAKGTLSIFTLIATITGAYLLNYDPQTIFLIFIAITTLIIESMTGIMQSAFVAVEKIKYTTIIRILRVIVRTVITLIFLYLGYKAKEVLLAFLLAQGFSFILHLIYYELKIQRIHIKLSKSKAWNIVKKGLPFGIATVFITIYFKIDITMLSKMQGEVAVGIYSAAYTLLETLYYLPIALSTALLPSAAKLYKTNKKKLKHICEQASRFLFVISIPLAFGATLLAEKVILLVYGQEYIQSAAALKVLIWTVIPSFYTYILGLVLVSSNNEKAGMYITGFAALINIVINYYLIPLYSFNGAAIATIITEVVLMGTNYIVVGKKLFFMNIGQMIKPLIASIIMGLFLYFVDINIFISIGLGILIYIITMYIIKGVTKEDITFIKKIIKKEGR